MSDLLRPTPAFEEYLSLIKDLKTSRASRVEAVTALMQFREGTRVSLEHRWQADLHYMYGVEAMITDTFAARTIDELEKYPLYTGRAESCVAVLMGHPDIGAGASHYNTRTEESKVRDVLEDLGSDELAIREKYQRFIMDPQGEMRRKVTLSKRMEVVALALGTALDQFQSLVVGRLPANGTFVCISGVDYSLPPDIRAMNNAVYGAVGRYGISDFESHLGATGGYIWGGPNHNRYSTLQFMADF